MDTFLQDLRYAFRQIGRSPAFTLVAILTLAIGIGANTALYTLIDSIFVRPLPGVQNDGRLVWISPFTKRGGHALNFSYPDFLDYRDSSGVFSQAAAFGRTDFALSVGDKPVRVFGGIVSGNFFSILGVRMALGRGFTPEEDDVPDAHPVAVLSHHAWQERFGGTSDIIGKSVVVNGTKFTVVGVAPERFNGAEHDQRLELWVPIAMQARAIPQYPKMLSQRNSWWLKGIGQLAPGKTVEQAKAAAATIAARLAAADSVEHGDVGATVAPLEGGISPNSGADIFPIATLAAAATGMILLICCANVSNMLLARAAGRRREIAVRLSLGAGRRRIVRQLLTEAMLLALMASVIGILISAWGTDLLGKQIPAPLDVTPDTRTAVFAVVAACVTGIFFGLVPALHATRGDLTASLKDTALNGDHRRSRLQSGFVVAQISFSLVLLVMAGVFLSSLYRSTKVKVGFEATSHVLAASFDLGLQGYTPELGATFVTTLEQRVSELPGVAQVAITNNVPMGERRLGAEVALDPRESEAAAGQTERHGLELYENIVRPGFFKTLGIGLIRGRDFAKTDVPGSEPVAIVSEDFARQAWPGAEPIGKHISYQGPRGPFYTVIGVAREATTYGVNENRRPTVYRSQIQIPKALDLTILVRSPGDASQLARAVTDQLHALDRNLPVFGVQTLGQYRYDRTAESRLGSGLLAIVGALALILACLGVYSMIAFSVGQRTREIGVRIALGAAQLQVVGLFLREGVRLTMVGVVAGLFLSALVVKLLSSMFMGVALIDSLAFIAVALILSAVAGVASWVPARRAALVDPMVALRSE